MPSALDTARYSQRLEAMRQRVQMLYRQGGNPTYHDPVLSAAFEELAAAMEELRALDKERQQQYEEWLNDRAALELECRRHQDLFTYAPAGYLVTNLDGTIRQANAMAAALFQTTERFLVGRSLALFVPDGQRRAFRAEVAQLRQADQIQEWKLQLQPWKGPGFHANLFVRVIRGGMGQPVALYWLLHAIDAPASAPQREKGEFEGVAPQE
jgi:PAS domain S-box-containing protein